eukprot:7377827-Prymnesium_polylepis.1
MSSISSGVVGLSGAALSRFSATPFRAAVKRAPVAGGAAGGAADELAPVAAAAAAAAAAFLRASSALRAASASRTWSPYPNPWCS